MKIIHWYLARVLLVSSTLALFVLTALSSLIKFFDQFRLIGRGTYTLFDTFIYTLYLIPKDLEMFAPMAVLLGSLIGMGSLAARSELIILQSIGLSKFQIIRSSFFAILPFIFAAMLVSEYVAPRCEEKALQLQSIKLSGGDMISTLKSVWSKDHNQFINIGRIKSLWHVQDLIIYKFDEHNKIQHITSAKEAFYEKDHWHLHKVKIQHISPKEITSTTKEEQNWQGNLTPEKLKAVGTQASSMSLSVLQDYIDYLKANDQDAGAYELAFIRKLYLPINMMVMVVLSLSFVFGSPRHTTMGTRMLSGILLGFSFYILNEVSSNLSIVYHIPALIAAVIPSIVFSAIAAKLLRR